MNVAFILNRFPVISQTFILNQVTGLLKHKNVALSVYPDTIEQSFFIHEKEFFKEISSNLNFRNQIISLEKQDKITFFHKILCLSQLAFYLAVKKNTLLQLNQIISYSKKIHFSLWEVPQLIKIFSGCTSHDILHCHFGPNGMKGLMLRKLKLSKGKIIVSFHGYDITEYIQRFGDHVYDELFKEADLFLPISENWKNKLVSLGCPENKIVVHHMGVDCERFKFQSRTIQNDDKIRILSIARLVEKKGIEYGIRAFSKVYKNNPNIEYYIVGEGPLRDELESLVEILSLTENVHFLGWKNPESVIEILGNSHFLLAPSITSKEGDQEGIPVVLMEAMAMGIIVISTYHSGIPELVLDQVTGFLVPERDIDELALTLEKLCNHQSEWSQISHKAREYIEENFNIKKLNRQLVKYYENLSNSDLSGIEANFSGKNKSSR